MEGGEQVRERDVEGAHTHTHTKTQRYQRRASKTISRVSWVICHPAFFRLQSGRCVLEYCKWESVGCVVEGGGGSNRGRREGRENLIPLINADTGPV